MFELVSAELCLDYVQSLSREEIQGLLLEIESKIGLRWIESYESFVISGTLRQVEVAYRVLIKGAYSANGNEVVSDQEIKNEEAPQLSGLSPQAYLKPMKSDMKSCRGMLTKSQLSYL